MIVLEFLRENWVIISFCCGELAALYAFVRLMAKSIKCTLRNDILDIYDRCKETKQITKFQLQSIKYSYDLYKRLKGNSFIDTIVLEELPEFEIID